MARRKGARPAVAATVGRSGGAAARVGAVGGRVLSARTNPSGFVLQLASTIGGDNAAWWRGAGRAERFFRSS